MIVPDVNLLVYAYNDGVPQHHTARHWWKALLQGDTPVRIPWVVSTGFIRLMANPRLLETPLAPSTAAGLVDNWFSYDHISPLNPTDEHLVIFRQCLDYPGGGPTW